MKQAIDEAKLTCPVDNYNIGFHKGNERVFHLLRKENMVRGGAESLG